MSKARSVFIVNSRLPVYKVIFGDGISDVVTGLFTRVAPKILLIGKEIASKAVGVLSDKIGTEAGSRVSAANDASNLAFDTFGSVKKKLMLLARKKPPKITVYRSNAF